MAPNVTVMLSLACCSLRVLEDGQDTTGRIVSTKFRIKQLYDKTFHLKHAILTTRDARNITSKKHKKKTAKTEKTVFFVHL